MMLDRDLAELYEVSTKRLNEQVKRNIERFPKDFMFQLNRDEKKELETKCHRFNKLKHSTSLPHVFTEHGALMVANVIKSAVAVEVSIEIVRAFVRLREMSIVHVDLRRKVRAMEKKYDYQFKVVFDAIKGLLTPPAKPKRKIGFHNE